MRCPDCNKFVSIEMGEPELDLEVDSEGNISGSVRLVQICVECGGELAEANLDIEGDAEIEHTADCKQEGGLEIDGNAENNDRYEGKGRGMKHFYRAVIHATIKCSECGAEDEFDATVEEQASYFDSLV